MAFVAQPVCALRATGSGADLGYPLRNRADIAVAAVAQHVLDDVMGLADIGRPDRMGDARC